MNQLRMLLLVIAMTALVGCDVAGVGSAALSVEEYIAATCGEKVLLADDEVTELKTWGDWADLVENERLNPLVGVVPPTELRDYHATRVAHFESQLRSLQDKPRDNETTVFAVLGAMLEEPEYSLKETSEFHSLSEELQQELIDGECRMPQ